MNSAVNIQNHIWPSWKYSKEVLIWSGLTRKFHQRFMKRIISTCTFQPTQLGNCWHTSICEEFKLAILFEYIEAPWSNTYIHPLCYSHLMSALVFAVFPCCLWTLYLYLYQYWHYNITVDPPKRHFNIQQCLMFLLNVCVAVFPSLILLGVLAILEPGEGASPFNTFNFLQLWNIFHAGHNTRPAWWGHRQLSKNSFPVNLSEQQEA